MAWTIFVEGHQRNIKGTFLMNYIAINLVFSHNKISKVFFIDKIGNISPTHKLPCFLINHDGLNNLGRGSPRKHSCLQNYIEIGPVLSDKKIF